MLHVSCLIPRYSNVRLMSTWKDEIGRGWALAIQLTTKNKVELNCCLILKRPDSIYGRIAFGQDLLIIVISSGGHIVSGTELIVRKHLVDTVIRFGTIPKNTLFIYTKDDYFKAE